MSLTILLSFAAFISLQAQAPASADVFDASIGRKDYVRARRVMGRVFAESPSRLLRYADDIEYMLLEYGAKDGNEVALKPQTDTLLQIYKLGIETEPSRVAFWKVRRALLTMRFGQYYDRVALGYTREAVEAAPLSCPLYLYQLWLTEAIRRHQSKQYSFEQLGMDWAMLDRYLYLRSIRNPAESEDCNRLLRSLSHVILPVLPPCEELAERLEKGIATKVIGFEGMVAYLAAMYLENCDDAALWQKAVAFSEASSMQNAMLARLAAAEALRRREYDKAFQWWEHAQAWEQDPAMRAGDLLFQAELRALQQDYRGARSLLQAAMTAQPDWGEPYLRLADLYRDGSIDCKLSAFDHKAIHWLMIDLCRQASGADPSYAEEANRRIYKYEQAMPTADELTIRGLHVGDTWPLRCWMSTVTTVKVR